MREGFALHTIRSATGITGTNLHSHSLGREIDALGTVRNRPGSGHPAQPAQSWIISRKGNLPVQHANTLSGCACCAVANGQPGRSPITTHMLDTSLGKPAAGVGVQLHRRCAGSTAAWQFIVQGITDANGRISNLLPPSESVEPGVYRWPPNQDPSNPCIITYAC